MEHYAKVVEDNAGGLTLYVMRSSDKRCVYAHTGYEYNSEPGRIKEDMESLIADDSISGWEGNEEELVAEWEELDLNPVYRQIIAAISYGKLILHPEHMGAAGEREFGVVAG